MQGHVEITRVYDHRGRKRGEYRVLIDRLWPRGVSKGALDHDEWIKDVAPSSELRRWFGHDPSRFAEFSRLYRRELADPRAADAVVRLRNLARRCQLVLLTAARDVDHSGALVLRRVVTGRSR